MIGRHKLRSFADEDKRASTAYDLIDWVRLGGHRMTVTSALRVIKVVEKWYPPAVLDVILQIDPTQTPIASLLLEHGYLRRYVERPIGICSTLLTYRFVEFLSYGHTSMHLEKI